MATYTKYFLIFFFLNYWYNFTYRYIIDILSHTNLHEPCYMYYHSHQNQVSIHMRNKVENETINEGVFLYFYLWCNVSNDFWIPIISFFYFNDDSREMRLCINWIHWVWFKEKNLIIFYLIDVSNGKIIFGSFFLLFSFFELF